MERQSARAVLERLVVFPTASISPNLDIAECNRAHLDTSGNVLISRFGRLQGLADRVSARPGRFEGRDCPVQAVSGLPGVSGERDSSLFRPPAGSSGHSPAAEPAQMVHVAAMFASVIAALARAMPIMRLFRWAKTCPAFARTADLRPLAFAVRSLMGHPRGFRQWMRPPLPLASTGSARQVVVVQRRQPGDLRAVLPLREAQLVKLLQIEPEFA